MTNNKEISIVKRDGSLEPLDIQKIHRVVGWACDNVPGVSVSEVESQAALKFYDKIQSSDVHKVLIDSAHDLITDDAYNYDLVAGRLSIYDVYKRAYGSIKAPTLFSIIQKNIEEKWYDKNLLEMYTEAEWSQIDKMIDHDLDFNFKIASVQEWRNKYLVQNRVMDDEYKETPQIAYILISAILMKKYVEEQGLGVIKDYYNLLSRGYIALPTPILAGLRTPTRQFSSCVVVETGDSLDSISATIDASMQYAARKAGLGIGVYNLRAAKQPIRGGEAYTTGVIPFTQAIQASVLACSQGAIRKGSITFFHYIWHKEVENLLVLKNNKGTEENRVRHSDHGFAINEYFYRKMLNNEDMFLFSPEEVPDLHRAYAEDTELFIELYEKACRSTKLKSKTKINAGTLRDSLMTERAGTGRIYIMNIDNSNRQGSFISELAPIKQSNLCVEIQLPTQPLKFKDDPDGLISLCTLSSIDFGKLNKPEDLEKPCKYAVMGLDALLDYQEYPLEAARNSTNWYRPLGVGVNNLAFFLAKRGLKYDESAIETLNEYMESYSYYLTKISVELAKKYGPCELSQNTKYSLGITPHLARKKDIDKFVPSETHLEWAGLISDLKEYGIRNATLSAHMPSETNSKIQNMTNGVEPVRNIIVTKGRKVVVPSPQKLKNKYQLAWNSDFNNEGYIKLMAVIQKWTDQSISANTYYDPTQYPDNKVPSALIFKHMLMAHKFGLKTLYYHNNRKDVNKQEPVKEVEIVEQPSNIDDFCESCAL